MDLVGYVRVSSDSQADGYGPEVQEQSIRKWAKAHSHRLTSICSDIGVSGALPPEERPGMTEALDALRPPPKATGLVVARLDRLARSLTVQEAILQTAWQSGASVFTADQGEVLADDPDDPMRTAMRQMAGVFAQLDRALVVKRMADGRRAKAETGRHAVGDYPFGFTGKGTGKTRDAARDPNEQRAVRRIIELRRDGASYRTIAETLDAEGLRPRRAARWSAMSVRNVAEREKGAGRVTNGEEEVHDHDFSPDNVVAIRGHLIGVHDLRNMKATLSELGAWELDLLYLRLHAHEDENRQYWEKYERKYQG